jgi:hypothetical protein
MAKHRERLPDMFFALMEDGIAPMPEDDCMMGWMAREFPDDRTHRTRVFPKADSGGHCSNASARSTTGRERETVTNRYAADLRCVLSTICCPPGRRTVLLGAVPTAREPRPTN